MSRARIPLIARLGAGELEAGPQGQKSQQVEFLAPEFHRASAPVHLYGAVGTEASVRAGESAHASEAREEERSVTDTEADEMEEHLRGLGYLE
jgi:hypothetical protein